MGFGYGLTTDVFADQRADVRALSQTELDKAKPQVPTNVFEVDDPLIFPNQVTNAQMEKLLATATLTFGLEDQSFAEHIKVLTGQKEACSSWHTSA